MKIAVTETLAGLQVLDELTRHVSFGFGQRIRRSEPSFDLFALSGEFGRSPVPVEVHMEAGKFPCGPEQSPRLALHYLKHRNAVDAFKNDGIPSFDSDQLEGFRNLDSGRMNGACYDEFPLYLMTRSPGEEYLDYAIWTILEDL